MPSTSFVQVATDGSGKRIRNMAIQAYVDAGDGNGPVLQTLYMQVTGIWPVDTGGNFIEADEFLIGAEWKRQLLDEMRAIRIGMQQLVENRRDFADCDEDILSQAQAQREESEDSIEGRTEAGG